jgi:uncharacterized protein YaaW (UPF0174 family)
MGFEKYNFVKDNAQLFELAEQEKLKMQVQNDLQAQATAPSMDEEMLNQQLGAMEQGTPPVEQ